MTPGELLHVDRLEAKEGEEVNFKAIWSASEEGKEAGKTEAKVTAEVVRHLRGPKIIVFRKKTKKAYEKASGSRQELTEIKVKAIA